MRGMPAPRRTVGRARSLRRSMTLPEVILWQALRQGALKGLRFRRQHPIGPYGLDFYCSSARLAVEVDGDAHGFAARVLHDRRRDAWLARHGVRVIRIAAREVLRDEGLDNTLLSIAAAAEAPSTTLRVVPLPRGAGEDPVGT